MDVLVQLNAVEFNVQSDAPAKTLAPLTVNDVVAIELMFVMFLLESTMRALDADAVPATTPVIALNETADPPIVSDAQSKLAPNLLLAPK